LSGNVVTAKLRTWVTAPADVRAILDSQKGPEAHWAWFDILAQTTLHVGESARLETLVTTQGECVSVLPCVSVGDDIRRGLTSPYTTQFKPPFGEAEHALRLGREVAAKIRTQARFDCLDIDDVGTRAFIRGLRAGGLLVGTYRHFANWFEAIDRFSDFWASRGSQLKSTIKRKSATALRDGHLDFELVDLATDRERAFNIYESIYAKSWKPPEPHPAFVAKLLDALGPRGYAQMGIATIAGEPAAAQIWLVEAPNATIFKLAHDPKFDRYSPGSLLTHWLLRQFCEDAGILEVDFGRGDDTYKKNWLHSCRYRYGVIAANPRTLNGLSACVFDVAPTLLSTFLRDRMVSKSAP